MDQIGNIQQEQQGGFLARVGRGVSAALRSPDKVKMVMIGTLSLLSTLPFASQYSLYNIQENITDDTSDFHYKDPFQMGSMEIGGTEYNVRIFSIINVTACLGASILAGIMALNALSISRPNKIGKIAVPIVLGSLTAISINVPIPSECFTTMNVNYRSGDNLAYHCQKDIFNRTVAKSFFPNCTVALKTTTDDSPDFGGLCNNVTVEDNNYGLWENWVYKNRFPSLEIADTPGYCSAHPFADVSLTYEWIFPEAVNYETLNYWYEKNHSFYTPMNIQCFYGIEKNNSDGSWEGWVNCSGWSMYRVPDKAICTQPYNQVSDFLKECASPALKSYYLDNFEDQIVSNNKHNAEVEAIFAKCDSWIGYVFWMPVAILVAEGIGGIYLECKLIKKIATSCVNPYQPLQQDPLPPAGIPEAIVWDVEVCR